MCSDANHIAGNHTNKILEAKMDIHEAKARLAKLEQLMKVVRGYL